MSRFFLGVDVGGTKSHALIADETGQAAGFGEGGAGNYEVVGWEGLRQTLQAIVERALSSAGLGRDRIEGAGFGIAGYDWPGERGPTVDAIETLGLSAPYVLVNDATIGLVAGASEGWGVVVVAGTSNNCRGRDQEGRIGRVTGCGSWFGEYGGAAELVGMAVRHVAAAWTQRGPETRLSEAFIGLVGANDVADLLEGLYLGRYQISAGAAPLVFQVAVDGDAVAREAICWAGRELGSLAVGVIRQLGMEMQEFEVVLAGSLYDGGPMLTEAMRETIQSVAPGARLVRLTAPPVVGAVLLGMEQAGLHPSGVRARLIDSTNALLGAYG